MTPIENVAIFDRVTDEIRTRSNHSLLRIRVLQHVHRALAPFGYLGVSKIFKLITTIFPSTGDIVVEDDGSRFRFPANDYYWNRLLDARWEYEPEIENFLTAIKDTRYTFIDLGANFGYWSSRIAAGLYGDRNLIAVEPSSFCFEILKGNLDAYKSSSKIMRRAMTDHSGSAVKLYGVRHAGFSIDPSWSGASKDVAGVVQTISLDDLLAEVGVHPATEPVVVKLDVEGVEKQVLCGALKTIAGNSVFLIEDASGPTAISDAIAFAFTEMKMNLYTITETGIEHVLNLESLNTIKQNQTSLQQTGINFIATASPLWCAILNRVNFDRNTRGKNAERLT